MDWSTAKAKPLVRKIMTVEEVARQQAERVDRARVAGGTIFLAKMFAGREPGKWENYNALLGLDYRIEKAAALNQVRFDAVGAAVGRAREAVGVALAEIIDRQYEVDEG